jgi:hypothetical protein
VTSAKHYLAMATVLACLALGAGSAHAAVSCLKFFNHQWPDGSQNGYLKNDCNQIVHLVYESDNKTYPNNALSQIYPDFDYMTPETHRTDWLHHPAENGPLEPGAVGILDQDGWGGIHHFVWLGCFASETSCMRKLSCLLHHTHNSQPQFVSQIKADWRECTGWAW